MTDQEILSKRKVTIADAAKYLCVPENHLRSAIKHGRIDIGSCDQPTGRRWVYHIEPERLIAYKHATNTGDNAVLLAMIQGLESRVRELENWRRS